MKPLLTASMATALLAITACTSSVSIIDDKKVDETKQTSTDTPDPIVFACGDTELGATLSEDRAIIQFNGQTWSLPKVGSPTGVKFEDETTAGPMTLWIDEINASFKFTDGFQRNCTKTDRDIAELPTMPWLSSKEWVVEDINKGGVIDNYHATMTFDGVSVSGSTGCNSFSGRYVIAGSKISFSPLLTTRRGCAPAIMDLEQKFLRALTTGLDVQLKDTGALVLTGETGSVTAL